MLLLCTYINHSCNNNHLLNACTAQNFGFTSSTVNLYFFKCALEWVRTFVAAIKKYQCPGALSFHAEWPGNIWLTANLQWCEVRPAGGKGDEGALCVHAAQLRPLKCHMASSAEQSEAGHSLLKNFMGNCPLFCSAAQQFKVNWQQNCSLSLAQQCSPVHT